MWNALVNVETEDSISLRETAHGSFCIGGGGGEGGGSGLANSSFVAEAKEDPEHPGRIEVKMLGGTAQGLFGAIEVIPNTYWTSDSSDLQLFDDYNSNLDDLHLSDTVNDGDLFWLEYDPTESAGSRWSVEHGSSLPQSATSDSDEDVVNYFSCVTLFRVRIGATESGVVQNHYGGVLVPTATNVVDVQTVNGQTGNGQAQGGE